MQIINLTNPGQSPADGDKIRIVHDNGTTEEKQYWEPVAPPPAPADPCEWLIDVGPFFDRFGAQKIPILANPDATVQAIVKDTMARKWIDLSLPSVGQAIDVLISKGHAIDKTAILTAPVTDYEHEALKKVYFK